jgi:uncharacterized tellurite resistance protein B-like protein
VDQAALRDVIERSRAVREESVRIVLNGADVLQHVGAEQRRSLLETTAALDREVTGHPVMRARLDRLALRLGRSPEIEQAKALIADRYGITRGEAFEVLRRMSSRSNRKLRDVAAEVVHGRQAGPSRTRETLLP